MSEDENSMESGTDGTLDTDSQAEEKPHEQTKKQDTATNGPLAVTQRCTKERNQEKEKKTRKINTQKKTQRHRQK